ncbi:MAG: M56 family metallopeptidase [Bryobacteraceae bacterium]|jgi:TonB family protein
MSGGLLWNNFIAYCLQVGLLIGASGWLPAALRMRSPKARLLFWHALLAACLLIPLVQPWRSEAVTAAVQVSTGATVLVAPAAARRSWHISPGEIALAVLMAGCMARLGLLATGFWRLRRYRRNSIPLEPAPAWAVEADLRLSSEIASPVTFGLFKPVVLLPSNFPEFDRGLQDAILCHEILHVRRRDWLAMLAEELVRAGLWFHPAIWWLLGEIQLAREQTVDRAVIDMTKAREQYVDALLTVAGAALQLDLAPAPLFLRKRHLKLRVVSILKEKSMSKTRTVSTLAAGLAILAGACWFVTAAFPLWAAPQAVTDAAGVSVDAQGAHFMHRAPVLYPRDAQIAGAQGTVLAEVKVDAAGNVSDASILSGPEQLRKPVLQSVLSWHFTKDAAGSTRQIGVTFHLPDPETSGTLNIARDAAITQVMASAPSGGVLNGKRSSTPSVVPDVLGSTTSDSSDFVTIQAIQLQGLGIPDDEFLAKLPPLHVSDRVSRQTLSTFLQAVHQLDEHLMASFSSAGASPNNVTLRISAPYAEGRRITADGATAAPAIPGVIPVGGRVQNNKLISSTQPVYPDLAKNARIQGTVELATLIGPDGHVQQLKVVSGHPLLRQAALDAVKEWVYQPTLLNEKPVSVSTTVDIIFTLSQ